VEQRFSEIERTVKTAHPDGGAASRFAFAQTERRCFSRNDDASITGGVLG
jgi:hypothetical protein